MRSYVFVIALGVAASGCHHHPKSAKSPNHPSRSPRTSDWTTQTAVQEDLVGPCTVPVVKDEYSGFEIGRPNGWTVDYGNGTIEVDKDPSETVGAIVYPARLKQGDISADRLADMFGNALGNSIRSRGGSFALTDKQTDGRVAHAQATATLNGANLRGPLQVVSEKGFATVKLYWAPEDRFANEEPTLRQVVTCFKRHTVIKKAQPTAPAGGRITRVSATGQASGAAKPATKTALQPFQSKYFVGSMPTGWRVADETANGIDLVSGDQQLAVGFGWVLNGRAAPEATVRQTINQFHPGARIVSAGPVQTERPDQVSYAAEYDSPQAHGMSQSTRGPNAEVETSLAAMPSRWESEKATLQAIAHSIQITPNAVSQVQANVRAQIASLPRATPSPTTSSTSSSSSVMASWADQERHDQAFSDALLGQDRATSPTTGQSYVVPWNAWSPTGPQGAGYYRATPGGGSELLDVQQ